MHIPMQPLSLLTLLTLTSLLTPTTSARPTSHHAIPAPPLQPHRTWFIIPHSTDGRPPHIRPSYFSPHDTRAQTWLHTQSAAYARAAVDAFKTREEYLATTLRTWIGQERDAYAPHDETASSQLLATDTGIGEEEEHHHHAWHHPHHHHQQHTRPSFGTLASSRYQQAARLYNYKQDYFRRQGQEWLLSLAEAPERLFFVLVGMVVVLVGVLVRARIFLMGRGGVMGDEETLVVSGERKVLRTASMGRKDEKKDHDHVSGTAEVEVEVEKKKKKENMSEKERFVEGKTKTKTKTPCSSPKLEASVKWS